MIGLLAGYGSRLSGNEIFIGRCAGCGYYSGSNNIFIGERAGLGYVVGSGLNITYCSHKRCLHNNVFIGYRVGVCNSNSDVGYSCNNILIGCDINSPSNSCGMIRIRDSFSGFSYNCAINLDNIQNNIEFYIGSGSRLKSSSSSNIILGKLYSTSCAFTCYNLDLPDGEYRECSYTSAAPAGNDSSYNVAIGVDSFNGDCVNNNILLGWSSGSTCPTSSFAPKGYNGFPSPTIFAQDAYTQQMLTYPSNGFWPASRGCQYQEVTSFSPDGIQDYDDCGCGLFEIRSHQCDNHIGIGNTCSTNFFTKMNTKSEANSLQVAWNSSNGELRAYTSSRRFKTNIRPFLGGIKETLELNSVIYDSIENSESNNQVGFIAEEVEEVGLKEFVIYDDNNKPLSLNYANMVALLTNTIKELNTENEELNEKIRQIEETFNNHL